MEMNVEKTEVMRISRQPFPLKIMRPKTTRGGTLNNLGSM